MGSGKDADVSAYLTAAVDKSMFKTTCDAEYLRDTAIFAIPTRESIDARLCMGEGSTPQQCKLVLTELVRQPLLCREYTPNAPPPLPQAPLRLPFKPGAQPPFARQWPMSLQMKQVKSDMLKVWKQYGVIEPSNSY